MKRRSHHKAAARASYALQREFKAANDAATPPLGGAISSGSLRVILHDLQTPSALDASCELLSFDAFQALLRSEDAARNARDAAPGAQDSRDSAHALAYAFMAFKPFDLDAMCDQARAAVRSTVERHACAHAAAIYKVSDAEIDRTYAIHRAYRRDVDAILRRLSYA